MMANERKQQPFPGLPEWAEAAERALRQKQRIDLLRESMKTAAARGTEYHGTNSLSYREEKERYRKPPPRRIGTG